MLPRKINPSNNPSTDRHDKLEQPNSKRKHQVQNFINQTKKSIVNSLPAAKNKVIKLAKEITPLEINYCISLHTSEAFREFVKDKKKPGELPRTFINRIKNEPSILIYKNKMKIDKIFQKKGDHRIDEYNSSEKDENIYQKKQESIVREYTVHSCVRWENNSLDKTQIACRRQASISILDYQKNPSNTNGKLDLSSKGFNEFPNAIFLLSDLKELNLKSNGLTELTEDFTSRITKGLGDNSVIKSIDLRDNPLQVNEKLIEVVNELRQHGCSVKLSENIENEIKEFGYQSYLEAFNKTLLNSVAQKIIEILDKSGFDQNMTQKIEREISKKNYTFCFEKFNTNDIASVKEFYGKIPSIIKKIDEAYKNGYKTLSLENIGLESFPEVLIHLKNLENLDLSGNSIGFIPAKLLEMDHLKLINLTNTGLATTSFESLHSSDNLTVSLEATESSRKETLDIINQLRSKEVKVITDPPQQKVTS